ncbi:MAG TPA: trypsin-like peptidase domain-containing protein [Candidatus Angelobacter sp.]
MFLRKAIVLCIVLFSGLVGHPQDAKKIPVRIKAILLDRDLNQKPVGKSKFTVVTAGGPATPAVEVTTDFDGSAEIMLPTGEYRIVSVQAVDFQGKQYSWNVEFKAVAPKTTVELSNNNAATTASSNVATEDLVSVYKKYRNSVVTVQAEYGPAHGTGFIIDQSGLILTNQHVIKRSEFVAVQLDERHRFRAVVLADDPEKDVAVLWVNFEKAPETLPVPLLQKGDDPAVEGEKVFTIGSPLHQSKVMTTGIVSKVEKRAIISDVNINHGNSGGPLFNSRGVVIGITTFGDFTNAGGPGISGIVRIEEAARVIEAAKTNRGASSRPPEDLLPNEPTDTYPLDAIKQIALQEKFKIDPYIFGIGDYDVAIITPVLRYRHLSTEVRAAREKEKRTRMSSGAVQGTFQPLENLKGWKEYVGEYSPVLVIQASPKLGQEFRSAFLWGARASTDRPAIIHFKTDFYKMKLLCGSEEVQPLMPGKAERVFDLNNGAVNVTDVTFDGLYVYAFDAIQPQCGTVTLQLFSEKNPTEPKIKQLDVKTITAVFNDFEPYRKEHAKSGAGDASR